LSQSLRTVSNFLSKILSSHSVQKLLSPSMAISGSARICFQVPPRHLPLMQSSEQTTIRPKLSRLMARLNRRLSTPRKLIASSVPPPALRSRSPGSCSLYPWKPFTVLHDSNEPLEYFSPCATASYTTARPFTLSRSLPSIPSSLEAAVLAGS
jgi:hypothetical protein